MSIASELQRIIEAKTAIIQSIINKGVDVPEEAKIEDFADLIGQIGPEPTPPEPSYHYTLLLNWADENTPSPDSRAADVDITYVEGMDDPSD